MHPSVQGLVLYALWATLQLCGPVTATLDRRCLNAVIAGVSLAGLGQTWAIWLGKRGAFMRRCNLCTQHDE